MSIKIYETQNQKKYKTWKFSAKEISEKIGRDFLFIQCPDELGAFPCDICAFWLHKEQQCALNYIEEQLRYVTEVKQ